MRIGLFGGSFDPVHHGHLIVAAAAHAALGLDHVRLIPAAVQPLKAEGLVAPGAHRQAMLEAAVAGDSRFVVDTRELLRGGPSYTVDTLEGLRAERPADQLFFLLGADAARDLSAWRSAERLPDLATIVVLSRPGATRPDLGLPVRHLEVPAVDVSSTALRAQCAGGGSLRYYVPDAVAAYIARHGLYREGT